MVPNPTSETPFEDPAGLLHFTTFLDVVDGMAEPQGGWSRLVEAIEQGRYDHVLNSGSPVPYHGRAVPTLLWCCAAFAPADVVRALLERGADPRVWTGSPPVLEHDKALPINVAASRGRAAVVSLLLAHGAEPEPGETVAAAIDSGSLPTVEVLLARGVDAAAPLRDGRTLVQAAQDAEEQLGVDGLIAALRHATSRRPRRALEVVPPTGRPGGLSAFVEPRLRHAAKPTWGLLATECGFEELATVGAGRHERDIARREVLGRHGIFLIRFRGSRWTWALLQLAGLERLQDPFSLERMLELTPRARAVAIRGLSVMTQDGDARERHELRSQQRDEQRGQSFSQSLTGLPSSTACSSRTSRMCPTATRSFFESTSPTRRR